MNRLYLRPSARVRALAARQASHCPSSIPHRRSSTIPSPPKQYPTHIPLQTWQKHFLTLGSTLASFINPSRGDMIALLSETSGERHLPRLLDEVMTSAEGRELMIDRPRITSKSVDMAYLRSLNEGTFGYEYTKWLDWCRVGPDTRAQVQYISNPQEAYLMQRYRESHDFYHMICSMPVSTLGETVVKIFEYAHFGLPVALLSSIAGPLRLNTDDKWTLVNQLAPWAWQMGSHSRQVSRGTLLAVRWEQRWEMDFNEMRKELGISDPPVQVRYDVKRGFGGKKRAWTTTTIQKARDKAQVDATQGTTS